MTEFSLGYGPTSGGIWKVANDFGELQTNGSVDAAKNTGNIAKQTVSFDGLAQPFEQTFQYDQLYRLTEAKETNNGGQTWKQVFTYDPYGNRLTHQKYTGTTQLTLDAATHPAIDSATNRFSANQGYIFDKNGNVTTDADGRDFVFDGDNKQTEVRDAADNVIGRYWYDGEGRRVKKVTTTETTVFVYSGSKLIAEYSTATPPTNPTTRYTVTDQLGSPRVIVDAMGQVVSRRDFLPFGEEISPDGTYRTTARKYGSDGDVRQQFTGYQKDKETGLDFAEARMYENRHGRFTAVDPLLASGKSADPQTFNRYVYVSNTPLVMTDPSGMMGDYYDSSGNWLGHDGKRDGRVYFAQLMEDRGAEVDLYKDSIRETTWTAVHNAARGSAPAADPIQELASGAGQVGEDVSHGLPRGATNFGIGLLNALTNPLGPAGAAAGVPNPFAVDRLSYDNPRQAAYGITTEVFFTASTAAAAAGAGSAGATPRSVSLVPEMGPIAPPPVHGNSLSSLRPTWGYRLFQNDGTFLKNGITSRSVAETRYTRAFMEDKYMLKELFPNRRAARAWEFEQNTVRPGPLNRRR